MLCKQGTGLDHADCILTAARIFMGEQLLPTSTPLPTDAYPFLVATFIGWIWMLWGSKKLDGNKS
jgi:hypothetical protein